MNSPTAFRLALSLTSWMVWELNSPVIQAFLTVFPLPFKQERFWTKVPSPSGILVFPSSSWVELFKIALWSLLCLTCHSNMKMNVLCPSSTSGSTRQDVFILMFLISPSRRFNSKINQGSWTPFCLGWKLIMSLFGKCMLSHLSSYTEATVILESVISCPSVALSSCQTLGSYRGPAVSTDQLNIWIHPFILSIYPVLTADLIWQVLASEISVHFYSSFFYYYFYDSVPYVKNSF